MHHALELPKPTGSSARADVMNKASPDQSLFSFPNNPQPHHQALGIATALPGHEAILSIPLAPSSPLPGPTAVLFTQRSWMGSSCLWAGAGKAQAAPLELPLPLPHTGTLCPSRALPGPFHKHGLCYPCSRNVSLAPTHPAPWQGFAVPHTARRL